MYTQRKIVAGNIYHVLSRGVDKRKIFSDDKDHLRFIHDLFEFNNIEPVNNLTYYFRKDIARPYIKKPRKLLVEILTFCLMPNHYHLLLRPLTDEGVSKFMKRLNMGYAKYFNEKYQRSGALFEGRYKAILVETESHFIHLPYYIHLNPLDIIAPDWRKRKIKDYQKAMNFLENYRWSSFSDYIGKKNFPSITSRELLMEFFEGPENYKKKTLNWLKEMNWENIQEISLE